MTCNHSNTTETGETFRNGSKHTGLWCADCGVWLKWLSKKIPDDYVFWFGKHKGKKFMEVVKEDPDYCHWIMSSGVLSETQKGVLTRLLHA